MHFAVVRQDDLQALLLSCRKGWCVPAPSSGARVQGQSCCAWSLRMLVRSWHTPCG